MYTVEEIHSAVDESAELALELLISKALLVPKGCKRSEYCEELQKYQHRYPTYKILTDEQVKAICLKYQLFMCDAEAFDRAIPEKNLKAIESFKAYDEDCRAGSFVDEERLYDLFAVGRFEEHVMATSRGVIDYVHGFDGVYFQLRGTQEVAATKQTAKAIFPVCDGVAIATEVQTILNDCPTPEHTHPLAYQKYIQSYTHKLIISSHITGSHTLVSDINHLVLGYELYAGLSLESVGIF